MNRKVDTYESSTSCLPDVDFLLQRNPVMILAYACILQMMSEECLK